MGSNGTVLVFLGAGASASVGVPESKKLAEIIERKSPEYGTRIMEIANRIKQFGFSYDVEALLSVLEFWSDPRNTIKGTGAFFAETSRRKTINSFRKSREDARIKNKAKEMVVQECFINDPSRLRNIKLRYTPFFKDVRDVFGLPNCNPTGNQPCPPVDVFTTNYDNVVEEYCDSNGTIYCDGYRPVISGKRSTYVFDKECYSESKSLLRLYKLHGTVTYVRLANGALINMPLYPGGPLLISGKPAFFDLIYPGTYRYGTKEPQLELFSLLKEKLASCKYVITIGYSFGDQNILQIFHDVLATRKRSGNECKSFLVSPDAHTVIKEKGFKNFGIIGINKRYEQFKVRRDIGGYL